MPGRKETYSCSMCPLIFELGWYRLFDTNRLIVIDTLQLVCSNCGTLHRLIEEQGACRMTALPGPVTALRQSLTPSICSRGLFFDAIPFEEHEWQVQDVIPDAMGNRSQVKCSICCVVGRLTSLTDYLALRTKRLGDADQYFCIVCYAPAKLCSFTDCA